MACYERRIVRLRESNWSPAEVIENLQELEDEDEEQYESILDIWPDYPTQDEDFFFDEEEY